MKKILILLAFLFSVIGASAQKFAFVDSEYILKHMPEYKSALSQLDGSSNQWQTLVEQKFKEVERLYKSYQADQVLLSEEIRRRRENEIVETEKEAKEFQRSKFGPEGELFKLRNELIKPIQNKVSDAIASLAKSKYIDFVFDKGSDATMMIYANSSYDLSNEVIIKLGYKPGTVVN